MLQPWRTCLALASVVGGSILPDLMGNLSRTYDPPPPGTWMLRFPKTGSGNDYASSCQSLQHSYTLASSSWNKAHDWVTKQTNYFGGQSWSVVTDYLGATTLCDGHPRVPKSPATPIRTRTTTFNAGKGPTSTSIERQTYGWNFPEPEPTCRIKPKDCDPLWAAYSTSLASYLVMNATRTVKPGSEITPAPLTPPCMNQTEASSWYEVNKSLYGCGDCTIFGDDVRLLFFPVPTTVSRDMCASTPTAQMTYFSINDDALDVYAGKSYGQRPAPPGAVLATVDHHTLTSGTAYISIGKVYAQDRCTRHVGTTVKDVIIAMHSESILSLRYSQYHFQYFGSSSTQTGYPISYADFNHPIPWSAWNGMAWCQYPNWGGRCDIIYEEQYRPQLAIPGAIRQLNPRWSSCQNWYGGLYDPPVTLQTEQTFAVPTFSASVTSAHVLATTTAEPASTVQSQPASTGDAEISESPVVERPSGTRLAGPGATSSPVAAGPSGTQLAGSGVTESPVVQQPGGQGPSIVTDQAGLDMPGPVLTYPTVTVNGRVYSVTPIDNGVVMGTHTLVAGGPAVDLGGGSTATFGPQGLVVGGVGAAPVPNGSPVTIGGQTYSVAFATHSNVANIGTVPISLNGPAVTLSDGMIATLGPFGLYLGGQTTFSAVLSAAHTQDPKDESGAVSGSRTGVKSLITGTPHSDAAGGGSGAQATSTSGAAGRESSGAILPLALLVVLFGLVT